MILSCCLLKPIPFFFPSLPRMDLFVKSSTNVGIPCVERAITDQQELPKRRTLMHGRVESLLLLLTREPGSASSALSILAKVPPLH